MWLKQFPKKALARLGLRLCRLPKFSDPIAPFDLLELAVERALLRGEPDFYFIHFGFPDQAPGVSFGGTVRKFGLRGRTVHCPRGGAPSPAKLIASLPAKPPALLSLGVADNNHALVGAAFDAGLRPPIINLERGAMSPAQTHSLKLRLLDNGYRFIDVGADSVCLRLERD